MTERTIEYYERLADVFAGTPFDQRRAMWDAQDEEAKEQLAERGYDLSAAENEPAEKSIPPPPRSRQEPRPSPEQVAEPRVHRTLPTNADRLRDIGVDVESLSPDRRTLIDRADLPEGATLSDVRRLADQLGLRPDPQALARAAAHETPGGALADLRGTQIDLAPEDFAQAEKALSQIEKDAARTGFAGEQVTYGPDGRMRPAKRSKKK